MGNVAAAAVQREQLETYLAALNTDSSETRRTHFKRIRTLFPWLHETRQITDNPCDGWKAPREAIRTITVMPVEDGVKLFKENLTAPNARELLGRLALEAFCGMRHETAAQLTGASNPGGKLDTVLVLVATGVRTSGVIDDLASAFGSAAVVNARDTSGRGKLRVCSVDAATGLESPVVFLIGGAELLEREGDLQMPSEQREELCRDNTRRLYMGFTRAEFRLYITWAGKVPSYVAERADVL